MDTQPLPPDQCDAMWDAVTRHFPRRPAKWQVRDGAAGGGKGLLGRLSGRPAMRHGTSVMSCAFSPDGSLLAAAGGGRTPGADKTIRCWDVASQAERLVCEGHAGGVFCIDFDPRTGFLASAGHDHAVILWDLRGRDAIVLSAAEPIVKGHVALAGAEPLVAIGEKEAFQGRSSSACVMHLQTGEEVFRHTLPPRHVTSAMALSADGRRLAFASQDFQHGGATTLRVCSLPDGTEAFAERFGDEASEVTFTRLAFFAADTRLAAAVMECGEGVEATAYVLDASSGACLASHRLGGIGGALAVSPSGDVLACAGGAHRIELLELPGLEPRGVLKVKRLPRDERILSLAFSPDGELLAAGASSGDLTIYETP
jgi:WD40 repeat protein